MKTAEFERVFKLPFKEAEQFFRDKLTLESSAWDELKGKAHAKAFTSAGAYQVDLLAELRRMTDKAIAGGMDIREFRKQFQPLVERYGWQLKGGGAAWRSDLIWRTNISTAYQAGRWQQFADGGIEYLMYVHNDGVRHPRPNHVALNGKIIARNDPFWTANYPPNGWGCKCRAVAALEDEYKAAPDHLTSRPEGWEDMPDGGWNYNVGQAGEEKGYRALTEKLESLPNDIARSWMERFVKEPAYDRFIDGKIKGEFPVAVLHPKDMELLETKSQTVWFSADSLAKNKGEIPVRSGGHPELTINDYRMIPEIVDTGEVYQASDERLIILKMGEKVYRAALKRTKDGSENYFLSMFTTSPESKAVRAVRKKEYERIR